MSRIISNKTTTLLLLCFIAPLVLLFACTQNVYAEEITNSSEEAKPLTKIDRRIKEEQMRISKFSGHVRRDGDMLYLKFSSGIEKSFENLAGLNENEEYVYYEFKEHLIDLNLYILDLHFYEGGYYLVVSGRSEKEYKMYAYPEVSPDRLHMIAASDSGEAYGESSIQLWRVEEGELIEEFYLNPLYYNSNSFVTWQDNRTVIVNRLSVNSNSIPCRESNAFEAQFALRHKGDKWELDKEAIEGTINCSPGD